MRRPRPRLLLVLLVLTALTLTGLDGRTGSPPLVAARRGVDTVFGPAQRFVGAGLNGVVSAVGGVGSEDLRSRNRRLGQENDTLRRQLLDVQGQAATAAQLADLLKLKDEGSYTAVAARVVGYGGFAPFDTTVTLDVGSRDGIAVGQSVTSGRGLVGRTVRVGPQTTVVALLTDPTFSVGTRLNRAPQSFGLSTGLGSRGMRFELVGQTQGGALQVGDDLVTAGSDTFAPGIPVGRIIRVADRVNGSVPAADVRPYADLGALDLLQVITQGPRTTPRVAIPPDPTAVR